MIIDLHAHVGDFRASAADSREPMTWENLIRRLDDEGIDKAVMLPVYNSSPETSPFGIVCGERMGVWDQVVDAQSYADRVIPFCNMDARWGANRADMDFSDFLDAFQQCGCRGVGEFTCTMPYDDPRVINLFRQVGARGMPITIESTAFVQCPFGLQDDPGSPRLERLLQAAPQTVIIGHGPGFWAEIASVASAADKAASGNLGPISGEGSLHRLFRTYPNLYADISARSGFTALTRDVEFGVRFLNEFQDRLMFGTDLVSADRGVLEKQLPNLKRLIESLLAEGRIVREHFDRIVWHYGRMPQLDYLKALLREKKISQEVFDRIVGGNAAGLLGID